MDWRSVGELRVDDDRVALVDDLADGRREVEVAGIPFARTDDLKLLGPDDQRGARLAGQRAETGQLDARTIDIRQRNQCGTADERRHERRGRLLVKRPRRCLLLDPARVENGNLVGQRQGFVLIVRDVEDRAAEAAMQVLQLDLQFLAQLLVERRKRLVHEDHVGLEDDRPRDRHALPLAAGQLVDAPIGEPLHLHRRQHGLAAPVPFRPADTAQLQGIGDVLANAHVGEQRVALEHHAHVAPMRRDAQDFPPIDADAAGVGIGEAGDRHQQRCLARPRRPEKRHELAGRDLQRHIGQRREKAVLLAKPADEHRRCHVRPPVEAQPRAPDYFCLKFCQRSIISAPCSPHHASLMITCLARFSGDELTRLRSASFRMPVSNALALIGP